MATAADIGQEYSKQLSRGEFAFWNPEHESAWRMAHGDKPEPPCLRGKYGFPIYVSVYPSSGIVRHTGEDAKYATWDGSIECGRSYLVGSDVPLDKFIKNHRSALVEWQKIAYAWAVANPHWKISFSTPGKDWEVYCQGEYITFALPHQDAGGERHYISRDGRTKVLVNED